LILRNQNQYAEQAVKAKWRQRATRHSPKYSSTAALEKGTSSSSLAGTDLRTSQELIRNNAPEIPMPVSLRPSFLQIVHLRFAYDFASAQDHDMVRDGGLGQISQRMATCSPDSWFHSVLSAISFANFGGRLKSQEAKDAGAKFYGSALGRFAKAMSSPGGTQIKADEAILGIFLLGIYEVCRFVFCNFRNL